VIRRAWRLNRMPLLAAVAGHVVAHSSSLPFEVWLIAEAETKDLLRQDLIEECSCGRSPCLGLHYVEVPMK
jgi:hypothetical protein